MPVTRTTMTKEAANAEKARRSRVNNFAGDLGETLAELHRLQEDVAAKAVKLRIQDEQMSVLRHDLKRFRRDFKAAIKATGAPIFLETDERWLSQRNATIKFKSKPGGRAVVILRRHGRNRIWETGEGALARLVKAAREDERSRG